MSARRLRVSVLSSALSTDARAASRLARELGFSGIQFPVYSPALRLPELSATGRREFRQIMSAQNQELVALRHDLGSKGFGAGADVDQELARLDEAMETAKGLQTPLVCVDLGPLPEPAQEVKPRPKISAELAGLILLPAAENVVPPPEPAAPPPDPAFVSQVDAALFELGRRSDRYGVMLALRAELASFAALERALRTADCPWFGIDLDPVTVLQDRWALDDIFSRLGPLIRHVRGRDATRGGGTRTKPAPVGQGDTDWPQLLARLDEAGYHGWITIDPLELPDRPAAAAAAVRRLLSVA